MARPFVVGAIPLLETEAVCTIGWHLPSAMFAAAAATIRANPLSTEAEPGATMTATHMPGNQAPSTGMPALDGVLRGLRMGDNVVWQVEAVDDYALLVRPFVDEALRQGRRVVYFRFARHAPLVPEGAAVEVQRLSPALGFESFTASIHRAIEAAGPETFYVFDCLSDLAADWYSDLMLGNFFMVTCPYLYDLDTVTYFALLRDGHSIDAVSSIRGTTQLLIDVFRHKERLYIHPLKVDRRSSPTMYLPHVRDGKAFRPLTESAVLSEVLEDLS